MSASPHRTRKGRPCSRSRPHRLPTSAPHSTTPPRAAHAVADGPSACNIKCSAGLDQVRPMARPADPRAPAAVDVPRDQMPALRREVRSAIRKRLGYRTNTFVRGGRLVVSSAEAYAPHAERHMTEAAAAMNAIFDDSIDAPGCHDQRQERPPSVAAMARGQPAVPSEPGSVQPLVLAPRRQLRPAAAVHRAESPATTAAQSPPSRRSGIAPTTGYRYRNF